MLFWFAKWSVSCRKWKPNCKAQILSIDVQSILHCDQTSVSKVCCSTTTTKIYIQFVRWVVTPSNSENAIITSMHIYIDRIRTWCCLLFIDIVQIVFISMQSSSKNGIPVCVSIEHMEPIYISRQTMQIRNRRWYNNWWERVTNCL